MSQSPTSLLNTSTSTLTTNFVSTPSSWQQQQKSNTKQRKNTLPPPPPPPLSKKPPSFIQAPWRVPGNFEIPDIIKEAWERNKHYSVQNNKNNNKNNNNNNKNDDKKKSSSPNIHTKRWIPVGRSLDILPLPPPIIKVQRKPHAVFDAKLRKVLPRSRIMELNPKEIYLDLHQVGSGANGAVVRATKRNSKIQVAIKRCYIEDQDIPHHAYILRELRIMGCLNHPNLIQLKEASLWGDYLWMSMELMSCSVFNLLYNTTVGLTEGNTVRIAKECLEGLVYLHSKNYMHRDIKCENILLGRNGQVKLADFGLATPLSKQNTARLGTAKWMAPEVVSENVYKENVDIWSLAITIIEMMDRVPPLYYLENSHDIYGEILYGNPPSFNFTAPSKGMAELVSWMLNMDGAARPGAKAVLKRIHGDIKTGVLKCTKQNDLASLVQDVFPDTKN